MTDIDRRQFLAHSLTLGGALASTALSPAWAKFSDIGPASEGSKAPELIGGPNDWLNTGGKVLKLYGKGGLLGANGCVLVDFWDYTCINCIRTLPFLRAWHARYRDMGLTIIGIHTPEFEFEKQKANVAVAVKRLKLPYPVLVDSRYANWSAFGNQYWPRKYLINMKGAIVYDHVGEGGYAETENRIRKLLMEANPALKLTVATGLQEEPPRRAAPLTPEIYAGSRRGNAQFGSPGGLKPNAVSTYKDATGERADGLFYAKGLWRFSPESLHHARATADPFEDYVALDYTALEANAVIRPEGGKPFDLYLTQDGNPVDKADKGEDVRYDALGRSFVRVDAPRMYRLTENRQPGRHALKLGSSSPDFGLYSFTFAASRSVK